MRRAPNAIMCAARIKMLHEIIFCVDNVVKMLFYFLRNEFTHH